MCVCAETRVTNYEAGHKWQLGLFSVCESNELEKKATTHVDLCFRLSEVSTN